VVNLQRMSGPIGDLDPTPCDHVESDEIRTHRRNPRPGDGVPSGDREVALPVQGPAVARSVAHAGSEGCHRAALGRPMMAAAEQRPEEIRAVMFDFGGVISSSPFEAFARFEAERNLPDAFIRTVNATNPDTNAWAQLERNEIGIDAFGALWSAEALKLGHEVDAREVLVRLAGQIRPRMVMAIRTCREAGLKTACLTNNFGAVDAVHSPEVRAVYELFDAILESRALGVRKPDPRFYEMACDAVGVAPPQAVFLDDLGINLKPARAMGMRTIKVTDPDHALEQLTRLTGLAFD
jgi:putative hydrolase of the HAD superfamily